MGPARRAGGRTSRWLATRSWRSATSPLIPGPRSSTSRRTSLPRGSSTCTTIRIPGSPSRRTRLNQNYLTQGVTTIVTGNCGLGVADVAKYLATVDAHGAGTNVIHLIPHGTVRSTVMGNADRPPTPLELERMMRLVERGMEAGAWGLSTGLIYVPGRYADTSELIELSRVVRRHGGIYASHIRNEGARLLESIDEAIAIGKAAGIPVHISHLKASGKAYWGTVGPPWPASPQARKAGQVVTADQYPYIASSTQLAAMVVPHWAIQGSAADFARLAADPDRGRALRREIERGLDRARRRGLDPDRPVRAPAGMGRA